MIACDRIVLDQLICVQRVAGLSNATIECTRRKSFHFFQFKEVAYNSCSHSELARNLRDPSSMLVFCSYIALNYDHVKCLHSKFCDQLATLEIFGS